MSGADFERLLREALAVEARPMSEAQVGEVVGRASARVRPMNEFPVWAIAASAACLAGLALVAFSAVPGNWFRILAGMAAAANLALSPLAAVALLLSGPAGFGIYWLGLPLWVALDARSRGDAALLWGLFVLFTNLVGLIAYLLVLRRPPPPEPGRTTG